ncbi:hypothetical protein GWN49_06510 [Candidatus Bathyarchaeota archaeon]|nr:hypothetical protein [Candidatus Bathyarchaeota archaeon]
MLHCKIKALAREFWGQRYVCCGVRTVNDSDYDVKRVEDSTDVAEKYF